MSQVRTCMLVRLTSMYNQLSVEKAIAIRATATMAVIVASDSVTAEQGMMEAGRNLTLNWKRALAQGPLTSPAQPLCSNGDSRLAATFEIFDRAAKVAPLPLFDVVGSDVRFFDQLDVFDGGWTFVRTTLAHMMLAYTKKNVLGQLEEYIRGLCSTLIFSVVWKL